MAKVVKIARIEWTDSKSIDGWEYLEDIKDHKPAHCVSIGYQIAETKDCVVLVSTLGGKQILGRLTIPKCCIKKRKYLKC